ncbi:hypothetical protein QBC34DRAFT_214067 [Podospora aff. communis PSN243]|uniref:Uncharacterized protein n=1 Tax=Podospora aff. communis PSN243 TaxID=3040156 RepID=A0AAV9G4M8_9PEZI|nr:hypothetical protein QBC34DRAFT_214067 [Podospora aff. communis PSN243]
MKPLRANRLTTGTLLLLLYTLAKQASAAPPQTTPAAPPPPTTTLALPPSEPLLKLAKATPTALSPAYELEVELEDPDLELELDLPLLRDHDAGTKLDLRAATTAVGAAVAPAITPAPAEGDTSGGEWWHTGVDGNGDTFRYRQTTYYSCVTQGSREHCGWHRPILEVSGAGGLGEGASWVFGVGGRALVVGFAAGVFAYLMGR